jgi:Ca-activated chloride channel homolog
MIHFHSVELMWLLLIIPIIAVFFVRRKKSVIQFPTLTAIYDTGNVKTPPIQTFLFCLKVLALALIIIAAARPQEVEVEREFETKGIDIVMALDISGSMLAEDFKPVNRITVAKEEAKKFINARENDRIGLVVFARKSYTQCPLTLDYHILQSLIDQVEVGLIKDGTAVGLGIATAVNRLRASDAKSKIIILLTDGENNAGNIDPITASELAKSFGIRIYTIAIGRGGLVPFPIEDPIFGKRYVQAEVKVDETMLKRIADVTDGLFFSARDSKALARVYQKINELEKTEVKVKQYSTYKELYRWFLIPGAVILLMAVLMQNSIFLKIP